MAKLKTGRHTSALKQNRKAHRNEIRNQAVKSKIRTLVKKVEAAVQKKDSKAAQDLLKETFSAWDKAAKTNVIHKNTASNQKARLAKMVSSIAG